MVQEVMGIISGSDNFITEIDSRAILSGNLTW